MARSREGAAGLRHHPRLTDRFYEIFFEHAIDSHNITLEAEAAKKAAEAAQRKRENSPQIDLGDFE